MQIIRNGNPPTKAGPGGWFAGRAWVDDLLPPSPPARLHVLRVSFEPDARTAWHTHPLGQTLHILSGVGRVGKSGEPPVDVHPGDTVWIAPGERHWHGAAPGHFMVHLAIQQTMPDGNEVSWMDAVSDEEYLGRGEDQIHSQRQ
jgi:quercetin dioxygenase-like cupin family protein